MLVFSIKKTIFAQTFRTKCGEERQLLYTRRLLRYVFDYLKLRNFQYTVKDMAAIEARCMLYRYAKFFVHPYDISRGYSLLVSDGIGSEGLR